LAALRGLIEALLDNELAATRQAGAGSI